VGTRRPRRKRIRAERREGERAQLRSVTESRWAIRGDVAERLTQLEIQYRSGEMSAADLKAAYEWSDGGCDVELLDPSRAAAVAAMQELRALEAAGKLPVPLATLLQWACEDSGDDRAGAAAPLDSDLARDAEPEPIDSERADAESAEAISALIQMADLPDALKVELAGELIGTSLRTALDRLTAEVASRAAARANAYV
jgi:hypothetical protein